MLLQSQVCNTGKDDLVFFRIFIKYRFVSIACAYIFMLLPLTLLFNKISDTAVLFSKASTVSITCILNAKFQDRGSITMHSLTY